MASLICTGGTSSPSSAHLALSPLSHAIGKVTRLPGVFAQFLRLVKDIGVKMAMASRAVKLLGEQYAPVTAVLGTLRQFSASRNLMADGADPIRAPGSPGNVSAGTKDMDSGDREAVTEGSESPRDVAETMKQHDDAGTKDSVEDLKGKPIGQADKESVREDIAGSPV